jgi:hypothetical protein
LRLQLNNVKKLRVMKAQKHRARAVSVPAPTGGWNARDGLANMDEKDAVTLVNLFPGTTSVDLRSGYEEHSTGYGAQVETVMQYSGSTTEELKAIAGGEVYDATTAGAIGAAELSGLANSRWQYINVSTPGGNFLEMCNGADGVYTYNGATWTDQSASITGVTASNLININEHKNRVWFIEVGTLKAWYLPVQSITGAANALDLSAFCTRGGYLMAMGTWTVDAGYGVDDLAVFITSNGEVLVYRGTDPSSATTWALVGVWWIGSPVGRRCLVKWKGDLLLICRDGVVPLSGALQSSRVNPRVALTDKIQSAMSKAVTDYGSSFGWQLLPYPSQNMLILNVPVSTSGGQQQYVMNTITGAWCRFQGWGANCFELFEDDLYFGGIDFVGKAWSGAQDAGGSIFMDGLQAFNYFGSRGQEKRFSMMRPVLMINSTQQINGGINVDFDQTAPASSIGTASFSGAVWDTTDWDDGLWTDTLSVSEQWQGAVGVGYCGAPHLQSNLNGASLQWLATDIVMEPGAIL